MLVRVRFGRAVIVADGGSALTPGNDLTPGGAIFGVPVVSISQPPGMPPAISQPLPDMPVPIVPGRGDGFSPQNWLPPVNHADGPIPTIDLSNGSGGAVQSPGSKVPLLTPPTSGGVQKVNQVVAAPAASSKLPWVLGALGLGLLLFKLKKR